MNSIVHFEIPINSPEEGQKFYNDVFGWKISQWGNMDYWMVETSEKKTDQSNEMNSINGGMLKREGLWQHPILTIAVEDIEEALKKIEAAGGKMIKGKDSIGEMGWTAYFEDNQGNTMGLWQNNPKSGQ